MSYFPPFRIAYPWIFVSAPSHSRVFESTRRAIYATRGYSRIGTLRETPGAEVLRDGGVMNFSHSGYDHFLTRR